VNACLLSAADAARDDRRLKDLSDRLSAVS
jgi:hypothetical protein